MRLTKIDHSKKDYRVERPKKEEMKERYSVYDWEYITVQNDTSTVTEINMDDK